MFITTAKVAFVGGVRFGTGLLVNRLPGTETGWSAPCAIGSLGISFGIMAGLEITDIIVPLRTTEALNHFKKSFSLTLGGEAGFALGPIGRQGAAEAMGSSAGVNASTSLSNSRGVYGGLTLDGDDFFSEIYNLFSCDIFILILYLIFKNIYFKKLFLVFDNICSLIVLRQFDIFLNNRCLCFSFIYINMCVCFMYFF